MTVGDQGSEFRPRAATVAVVGAWNHAIFTPQWFGRHVLPDGDASFETQILFGAPSGLQFITPEFEFTVLPGRLDVTTHEVGERSLRSIERAVSRVLERLQDTPVQARGINLVFEVPRSDTFSRIERAMGVDFGLPVMGRQLLWSIAEPPDVFNLKVVLAVSKSAVVEVNSHRDVQDAAQARASIDDQVVAAAERSRRLLERLLTASIAETP